MDYFYLVVYALNIIFTLSLGFFVLYKNLKDKINTTFFLMSLSISGWLITLYFYYNDHFVDYLLNIGKFNFVFTELLIFFVFLFVYYFPKIQFKIKKTFFILFFLELIFLICLTLFSNHIVINEVFSIENSGRSTVFGDYYFLFFLHFLFFSILSLVILILKILKYNNEKRMQLVYFSTGLLLSLFTGSLTNIILPFIYDNFSIQRLGSVSSFFLVLFTFFAIVKHKLFELKVFATQIFVVFLTMSFIFPIFFYNNIFELFINIVLFILVVIFGIFLIKSVKKEVQQKEELAILAHNLEKANLRLQELDQQKTEFLSIASHQLRTPLTIIRGYIELIGDGAYGKVSKGLKETLGNMDESNDRLMTLVEEFLDITRIEQGRTKFVFAENSLNETISSVVKELSMKPEFAEKKLKISWKSEKNIDKIVMDEEKIRHVVFNFLDNAIKYSDKGTIKISLEKEDNGYVLKIKDQGFGFNKEDEVNFFQKFYRGKNVQGTNVNGTGLGIYVCKRFIEKHGGHVWAHSEGLGKGSEFGFWIPGVKVEEKGE
ncbi:MAG: HAMP domain-containing sensor histidine kinase [Candidatus Magasanikbacteria bacterium]